MREIDEVVVHCSASDRKDHDCMTTIRLWHIVERGWSDVGYHLLIFKSEGVVKGRPLKKPGAHVEGHNARSIGVMLAGEHVFTDTQFWQAAVEIDKLCREFNIPLESIRPHSYYNPHKTCPNFDVKKEIVERIRMIRKSR